MSFFNVEITKLALVGMFVHVFLLRHVLHLHSAFHFHSLCLMSKFSTGVFVLLHEFGVEEHTLSQEFLFAFWSSKKAKKKAWHLCYSSLVEP